jgi:hypothetical protein
LKIKGPATKRIRALATIRREDAITEKVVSTSIPSMSSLLSTIIEALHIPRENMALCPKMRMQKSSSVSFNLSLLNLLSNNFFDQCILFPTGLGIVCP